jgi:hypothetical protein
LRRIVWIGMRQCHGKHLQARGVLFHDPWLSK